jgi:hypothetical protein
VWRDIGANDSTTFYRYNDDGTLDSLGASPFRFSGTSESGKFLGKTVPHLFIPFDTTVPDTFSSLTPFLPRSFSAYVHIFYRVVVAI